MNNKNDKILKVNKLQRILMAGLEVAKKPDPFAAFLVDLEPMKKFIEDYYKENNTSLSYDFLILRGCAIVLPNHPEVTWMLKGKNLVSCGSIDIGVSVAGKGNMAPVAVIEDVNNKDLLKLREAYKFKIKKARAKEEELLKKLERILRWIPAGIINKFLLKFFIKSQKLRRKHVGNFQISSLSPSLGDFHITNLLSTTFLLSIGGISKRVLVVNNKPEARLSVYLVGQMDHRILDGQKAFDFCKELKDVLEHPEKLV